MIASLAMSVVASCTSATTPALPKHILMFVVDDYGFSAGLDVVFYMETQYFRGEPWLLWSIAVGPSRATNDIDAKLCSCAY